MDSYSQKKLLVGILQMFPCLSTDLETHVLLRACKFEKKCYYQRYRLQITLCAVMFNHQNTLDVIEPETVRELFSLLRLSDLDNWGSEIECNWIFRGQARASWPLLPKLWRPTEVDNLTRTYLPLRDYIISYYNNTKKTYVERLRKIDEQIENITRNKEHDSDMLQDLEALKRRYLPIHKLDEKNFLNLFFSMIIENVFFDEFFLLCDEVSLHGANKRNRDSFTQLVAALETGEWERLKAFDFDLEKVALAQHSGLHTRLLDWTKDPIKALVFALSDGQEQSELCVWALNHVRAIEHLGRKNLRVIEDKDLHPVFMYHSPSRIGNRFLDAQDGVFTFFDNVDWSFANSGSFPTLDNKSLLLQSESTILRKIVFQLDRNKKEELVKCLTRERKTIIHMMPTFERVASYTQTKIDLNVHKVIAEMREMSYPSMSQPAIRSL